MRDIFLFGFAVALLWWRFAVKQKHLAETERAYIELDLASLAYNAAILQAAMPQGSELMGRGEGQCLRPRGL